MPGGTESLMPGLRRSLDRGGWSSVRMAVGI